jgi:hypothetical protein
MIRVDRLVLDLPHIAPARAERLARAIGDILAAARFSGDPGDIPVLLPPGAASDREILSAFEAALRARIA